MNNLNALNQLKIKMEKKSKTKKNLTKQHTIWMVNIFCVIVIA